MTYTINMHETFDCPRTGYDALRYIADFSTIEQWDHTVISSKKVSDGAVNVGTKFDLLLRFGIRKVQMDYTIIEYLPPSRVVLKGVHPDFTAVDTVNITETNTGCHVDWQAEVTFTGSLARWAPRFENSIKAAGTKTILGLKSALEDNAPAPTYTRYNKIADALVWPGMWLFTKHGYNKAKKKWFPVSRHLEGKHVIITGCTSGIGEISAYDLAHLGATLTLVARSEEKVLKLQKEIIKQTGNTNIQTEVADMGIIEDVKALAERLLEKGLPVDVLINNAGALFNPRRETKEGVEQSFALLLLAPFIFTEMLYPLLKQANSARVINVTSGGMYTQRVDVKDMENREGTYSGSVAYAKAKRGLVISTEQWAERWADDNIFSHVMHPGWADTPGVANALPEFKKITQKVLRTPEEGADTITWLAVASEVEKCNGLFWLDREPHTTHIMRKTRETEQERVELRENLIKYAHKFGVEIA